MSERSNPVKPRAVASITAVVIAMVAATALAYFLLDVLLLLFLGIVVAAALQPWHLALHRWGIPKGPAVLLIYLCLLLAFVLVAVVVGPVVAGQLGKFFAGLPDNYAQVRAWLEGSSVAPLHLLGQSLPSFESFVRGLTGLAPQMYEGTLGVTTSIVRLPACIIAVLAIAFYWTLEVAQFERLLVSLIAVEKRPRALHVWHEIEAKLGGFLRGQGFAMLFIGVASAIGYQQIGLPNVLALGVLAGLLEAVPWIGPLLAVGPAVLVALPLGLHTVLLVLTLALFLQAFESNVLVPRIMARTVGVSALVGLMAILSFGALYGLVGVLVAIPMAAVIQVLLDTFVVNVEPQATPAGQSNGPWDELGARVSVLRQQARNRLRERTSRIAIDPATEDHGVDAVDEKIEAAVARVESLISATRVAPQPMAIEAQTAIVDRLQTATGQIEQAEPDAETDGLAEATERFTEAVEDAEGLAVAAREAVALKPLAAVRAAANPASDSF